MREKGLTPILIVLILAALVGGYLVYQNQVKPTPSPQPTIQPSPISDPTVYTESDRSANWKTYTNTKEGYQIRYPMDWYLNEPSCDNRCASTISNNDLTKFDQMSEASDKNYVRFSILVFTENDPSLKEFQKVYSENEQAITLNSVKGISRLEGRNDFYQLKGGDNVLMQNIYLSYSGKVYSLYYFPLNSIHQATINQILSTFKFLP